MSVVAERRRLKAEIKEKRKRVIPALKAAIKESQKARKKRVRECKAECKRLLREARKRAVQARKKLEQHVKRAQSKAREACKSCRVIDEKGVEAISARLEDLDRERQEINKLRHQASLLRSERGRAAGKKSAELRSESDDQVIRDLGEDQDLIDLFKKVRAKIKPSKYRNRTEAFFEYVHDHPEALAELRTRKEQQFEKEAEKLWKEREREANGQCWTDLERCQRELDELKAAERFLSEAEETPF